MSNVAASERIGVLSIDHEARILGKLVEHELFSQVMRFMQSSLPEALEAGVSELRIDLTEALHDLPWELVDVIVATFEKRFPEIRAEFDRAGDGSVQISLTEVKGVQNGAKSSVAIRVMVRFDSRKVLEEMRKAGG